MRENAIVIVAALVLGLATDLATDSYYPPGVMPVFVTGVTGVLILGAKWLGRHLLDRPVDSRPGDVDPAPVHHDLAPTDAGSEPPVAAHNAATEASDG
ncbi:hypothetical protein [Rhabdothermincola salaria]|uniref:hypothetical protein n=1 Tax=Rhabdothermincola salaria TaxID=2903142 RepID=UPI001E34523A|nr:hypothetical protein [Rhabdothermincola salaria]MCD9623049.1 hypothetical protein [Rhabdothermincola salaria]